jgi:hypothetical protein
MHRNAFIGIVLVLLFRASCSGQAPIDQVPDETPPPGDGGTAAPVRDTIAYARGDGDAIRLIDPDGTNDRPLWAHGHDDPHGVYAIWSMSWNPAGTALAFASTHESWCSLYGSDVFTIGSDGAGHRRITQAPGCEELASFPTGTVRVPVQNDGFDSFDGFLYFQGAPSIQPVSLAPFASGVVTFDGVADFCSGDAGVQFGMVIHGAQRELSAATAVDVIAGGTVTTGVANVFVPSATWEVRSPTWHVDGVRIGHLLNFDALWELPSTPEPVEFGTPLLADEKVRPGGYVPRMAWGPTASTADMLLYALSGGGAGVYRVSEGDAAAGSALVSHGALETIHGLAWLPDGSGFVYAVTEGDYFGADRSSNLFLYEFANAVPERVTSYVGDFVGQVSVSGDGARFVIELADGIDPFTQTLVDPDLWLVERSGGEATLLVEGAYAPAWSR